MISLTFVFLPNPDDANPPVGLLLDYGPWAGGRQWPNDSATVISEQPCL